jgi:FHS family L-fucose permease-like MFS transporter
MKRSYFIVGLVLLIFFVISFLTNILNSLLPTIKADFGLSFALAGFLPFSFFLAYGVMSVPSGMLIERFRERPVLVASFVIACIGASLFAAAPRYGVALTALFLIGLGMAMLQVAINPLLRVAGGEEHFAFFSVLGQLVFGLASWWSPDLYSYLMRNLGGDPAGRAFWLEALARLAPARLPWIAIYWIFSIVTLAMVVVLAWVRLPVVELKEEERVGTLESHAALFRNPAVILFFVGIFAYVGTEQGVGNWISEFLRVYHGCDPVTEGALAVKWFWGSMTVGCLAGLALLKLFDSRRVLVGFSLAALLTLSFALFGPARISLHAFQAMGFCLSVMWSITFSLALNSVAKHHGSFSGILCTGIVGGAVVPWVIGLLGDVVGLRLAMTVLYLTLGYILSIGLWARPLISNATILKDPAKGLD